MARRAIVSREVNGINVTVLALDTETAEPQNKTYVLNGTFADKAGKVDEKKVLRTIQKANDTDTFKNIKVVSIEPVHKLYGMWQEDFMALAFELDPATRKPIGQADAE